MKLITSTNRTTRVALSTLLVSATAALGAASSAAADTYTLNGKTAAKEEAFAATHSCAGIADSSGVVACFTSQKRLVAAQAAAARRGGTPPGWGYLPTDEPRETIAKRIEEETTGKPSAESVSPGGITTQDAGDTCYGYTNIHIWTNAGFGGTQGNIGPTGGWYNLSSAWTNTISSYRNSNYYTSWFSDYDNGGGGRYGPIGQCHWNSNLNDSWVQMSNGGPANDRFDSAWVGH